MGIRLELTFSIFLEIFGAVFATIKTYKLIDCSVSLVISTFNNVSEHGLHSLHSSIAYKLFTVMRTLYSLLLLCKCAAECKKLNNSLAMTI